MNMLRKFVRVDNDAQLGARQIRIVASDATPDRVSDIMVPKGCDIADYQSNPIILAQHDPHQPIGKSTVSVQDDRVTALVDFAPAGVSAKADEYCGLAKAGIINAASVGFEPVDFEALPGGGRKYTKWKLMEISLVSVPANPAAVVIGRAMPQTKADDHQWKVGASRNLPVDEDDGWDGPAAEKRIFEKASFDGDNADSSWARKAFLAYDAANPNLKGSYKLPFADVKDGRLTATAGGIRAAASRLSQTDIPDDVRDKARAVLDHYEAQMKDKDGKGNAARRVKNSAPKLKGLWDVAELAHCLSHLGAIQDMAKWEAEIEQDASKVPQMLALALQQLAASLIAMTAEECNELLEGHDVELIDVAPIDEEYVLAGATPQIKALRFMFRKAGRVLSQENMEHVNEISKCLGKMVDCHTKAADLHDDLHDVMVEEMNHGTSLGVHVKALMKSANGDDNDDSDADNGDTSSDDDEDDGAGRHRGENNDDDGELAYSPAARKRQAEMLRLSSARG